MNQLIPTGAVPKETKARKILRRLKAKGHFKGAEEPSLTIEKKDSAEVIKLKTAKVFNWYSHSFDSKKAKEWIVDYLSLINEDKKIISAVEKADCTSNPAGWIARIIINQSQKVIDSDMKINTPEKIAKAVLATTKKLPKRYQEHLQSIIKKMQEDGAKDHKEHKDRGARLAEGRAKALANQRQKVVALAGECLAEFDGQVDNFILNKKDKKFSPVEILKRFQITKDQSDIISEKLRKSYLNELNEVLKGKDDQLVEAYSYLTVKRLKEFIALIKDFIKECDEYKEKAPKTNEKLRRPRKPRAKKIKAPKDQIKKLLFLAESKEFKLKSIPADKIVGATQLWVFNTKYRYLGVYNASDSAGFSVKGSTLKNFDQATSTEKKLRKPQDILKKALDGGKVALRKLLPAVRCKEKKLTGRINKHTILLRVL
jgi:hypothetical protein